jgi:hypothetical protein
MNDDFRLGFNSSKSSTNTKTSPYGNYGDYSVSAFNNLLGIPDIHSLTKAEVFLHIAGVGDSEINTDAATGSLGQWNLRNTFSLQAANHIFKFGIDHRHIDSTIYPSLCRPGRFL